MNLDPAKLMTMLREERQRRSQSIFHTATPRHSIKSRGVGITRKNKEETKAAKKLAKRQRIVNRKISSKKSRPTGSKQRK